MLNNSFMKIINSCISDFWLKPTLRLGIFIPVSHSTEVSNSFLTRPEIWSKFHAVGFEEPVKSNTRSYLKYFKAIEILSLLLRAEDNPDNNTDMPVLTISKYAANDDPMTKGTSLMSQIGLYIIKLRIVLSHHFQT